MWGAEYSLFTPTMATAVSQSQKCIETKVNIIYYKQYTVAL